MKEGNKQPNNEVHSKNQQASEGEMSPSKHSIILAKFKRKILRIESTAATLRVQVQQQPNVEYPASPQHNSALPTISSGNRSAQRYAISEGEQMLRHPPQQRTISPRGDCNATRSHRQQHPSQRNKRMHMSGIRQCRSRVSRTFTSTHQRFRRGHSNKPIGQCDTLPSPFTNSRLPRWGQRNQEC